MSEKDINAYCSICGVGYHICKSCKEQQTFKPWRTVVDSIEHYKIYLVLHGYSLTKDKEKAKSELQKCDLSDLENFKPNIKSVIKEIMADPKKNKRTSKNVDEEKLEVVVDNDISEENVYDVE